MKQITTLNDIAQEINSVNSILLFCHVHPDGDTLGSAAALRLALLRSGKKCDIVCDGEVPEKYDFVQNFKGCLKPSEVKRAYDLHVAIDVATEGLLGYAWSVYNQGKKRICVDHHVSNERFAPMTFVKNTASSTMIIYDLIKLLNVKIDSEIANLILFGLLTDTGVFQHANVDCEVFDVASEMLKYGANIKYLIDNIYKSQSKNRIKLYLQVMNSMRFYLDDKLSIITILQSDLQKYSLKPDVTEGWVDDLPMSVSGIEVAVSVLQTKKNLYRISIRSKGNVNAIAVAEQFGGGGHKFASGCVISGEYEEVIEKIVRAVYVNI